jgi:Domain of unknown function (DUF6458)
MGIGVSLLLIAIGAILTWGVDVVADGVNLDVVGVILMIVGAIGLLITLVFLGEWTRRGTTGTATGTTVVHEDRL